MSTSESLMSATQILTQPSSRLADIAKITGPLLFGSITNWALYGVLCVQIYVYSYNFPQDKPTVKFIAYFVFVMETVQTALTGADIYYWFVEGFGDMGRLMESHFTPIDLAIIHVIVVPVIKGYFCFRIWTLNKRSLTLCMVIAFFTVGSTVGLAWAGIVVLRSGMFSGTPAATVFIWSISSALSDILITIAMVSLLARARSEGGQFSNFVMLRLVRLSIETNAVTTAVAIMMVVLYASLPDNMYFMFPAGFVGKLYSVTLFVSLNNRIYFRDHPSSGVHIMNDHVHVVEFDQSHHHFSPVGSITHTTTLNESLHTINLEKGKSDSGTVIDTLSDPSHPK